ncbi:MAG TPA: BACON domain-containing protein [Bacteroidales bacterium]|nr:BACON domain-containing protein [Bacteroidales bacterium]
MRSTLCISTALLFLSILKSNSQDATQPFPAFPPNNVTNEMDRDQMLWQMGIKLPVLPSKTQDPNRPADARPVNENNPEGNWTNDLKYTVTRSAFGLWNNYSDRSTGFFPGADSARVGNYIPIDLLRTSSGMPVSSADAWWKLRRPEIFADVQEHLYGKIPPDSILPEVTWSVETTMGGYGSDAYIQKVITGTIDISRYPHVRNRPVISATLRTPQNAVSGVPVIIFFGGFGNANELYWQRSCPEGWGTCIFNLTLLQPDNGSGLTSYLIGLVNKGNWRKPDDWGTLVAWSWGVSRLIDYFETDKHVNSEIIGLTGHSRYGKATLVTMAYEPRVAIGFPSDAGSLGTKMNRRHWGQDLEHSTGPNEYHWMAGNFFKWAGEKVPGTYLPRKIDDCPVDAHSLLALCAPRPVLINGGTNSTWCDPYGIYLTAKYATPVYELLGYKGLIMKDLKPIADKAYLDGRIAFRYHTGGHTDAPEWPSFFKFAARNFDIPVLNVSSSSLVFDAAGELETKLFISANGKADVVPSDYWIKVLDDERSDSLIVSITENKRQPADNFYPLSNSWSSRTGYITITAKGRKQVVFVHQASVKPVLDLSATEIRVGNKECSKGSFDILSNSAWTVSSDAGWLSFSDEAGINDRKITVSAAANNRAQKRVGTVKIKGPGFEPVLLVSVIQDEAAPELNVSTNSLVMDAAAGSASAIIGSNTPWELLVSSDWIIPGAKTGEGLRQVVFTAADNPASEPRKGTITIIANGVTPKVIEVVQKGKK